MAFPFNFVGEDQMTELSNAANRAFLLQRTSGFGSSTPTITEAVNGTAVGSNTGGDIFGLQPLIASVGLAIGGTVIDLELLKGGADMPRPAQGSFTVQGDLIVNASARNGMELIHRNITQDRNVAAAYAGGGAYPAAHTVVPTAALGGANDVDVDHSSNIAAIPTGIEYEVDPEVTISSPALRSGAMEAVVTITGTDRNGTTITRVARWNASNISTLASQKVGGYFRTITGVTSSGFTATSMGTVAVTDRATRLTFEPYDSAIVDYFDVELDIGNLIPFSFFGGAVNGVSFNFTRDEAVQYTLGCLFGRVGIRENVQGGAAPTTVPAGIDTTEPEVFVGTQCEVDVDGTTIPLDRISLTLSQSYVPSPYIGKTIWPKKPRRSGYRTLELALTFPATSQNNWLQYFQAHADFSNVVVRAQNGVTGTNGQFGGVIEWSFDDLVLAEAPTIATAGQDVASQTATLRPYSQNADAAFNIVTIQDDYPERLYRYA